MSRRPYKTFVFDFPSTYFLILNQVRNLPFLTWHTHYFPKRSWHLFSSYCNGHLGMAGIYDVFCPKSIWGILPNQNILWCRMSFWCFVTNHNNKTMKHTWLSFFFLPHETSWWVTNPTKYKFRCVPNSFHSKKNLIFIFILFISFDKGLVNRNFQK